jgi:hypothetical protein
MFGSDSAPYRMVSAVDVNRSMLGNAIYLKGGGFFPLVAAPR